MKFDNSRCETRSENRSENKSANPGFAMQKLIYKYGLSFVPDRENRCVNAALASYETILFYLQKLPGLESNSKLRDRGSRP